MTLELANKMHELFGAVNSRKANIEVVSLSPQMLN